MNLFDEARMAAQRCASTVHERGGYVMPELEKASRAITAMELEWKREGENGKATQEG